MAILYKTLNVNDACKHIGCGRSTLLRLAKNKQVPSFIVAGKLRFPIDGLDWYINKLATEAMKEVGCI